MSKKTITFKSYPKLTVPTTEEYKEFCEEMDKLYHPDRLNPETSKEDVIVRTRRELREVDPKRSTRSKE